MAGSCLLEISLSPNGSPFQSGSGREENKGRRNQLVRDDVPQHHCKILPGNLAQVLNPLLEK